MFGRKLHLAYDDEMGYVSEEELIRLGLFDRMSEGRKASRWYEK